MTELEWQDAVEPTLMLQYLREQGLLAPDRQRLLVCGCCHLAQKFRHNPWCKKAVEVAEKYADGEVSALKLASAHRRVVAIVRGGEDKQMALWASSTQVEDFLEPMLDYLEASCKPEKWIQVPDLIRCIFGNPFQPGKVKQRRETTRTLARMAYEGKWSLTDEVARRLYQTGDEHHSVIAHLKDPCRHARGCYVLRGILGLE